MINSTRVDFDHRSFEKSGYYLASLSVRLKHNESIFRRRHYSGVNSLGRSFINHSSLLIVAK